MPLPERTLTVLREDGSEEEYTEQCDPDEAEFWGVYGHLKEGGIDAITDCPTLEEATCAVSILIERSGLTRVFTWG